VVTAAAPNIAIPAFSVVKKDRLAWDNEPFSFMEPRFRVVRQMLHKDASEATDGFKLS
jgi:hypothetical protein